MEDAYFVKMHCLGNDFVILITGQDFSTNTIQYIAHRRLGIGCDQVVALNHQEDLWKIRFWNRDGSKALACGNGTRCAFLYLVQQRLLSRNGTLYGPVGPIDCAITEAGVSVKHLVNFDEVRKSKDFVVQIPEVFADHLKEAFLAETAGFDGGALPEQGFAVDVGNPHFILYSQSDPFDIPKLSLYARYLSRHALWPQGVNVSFVHIISQGKASLYTYERGTGVTMSCGSAACAAGSLLHRHRNWSCTEVVTQGGAVFVEHSGERFYTQTAEATMVFQGFVVLKFSD